MKPVLLEIGVFQLHAYGTMLAIAFLVGIFALKLAIKKKPLENVSFDTIIDFAVWILVAAIVGARLAYVITEYKNFHSFWEIFSLGGGLAFHGGLIGGFLAGYIFTRRRKIAPWPLSDMVAPYLALGYSIVRIGCFLNGCCYGRTAPPNLGMVCSADCLLRYPTQLYSMAGSFLIFLVLLALRNHRQFPGFLFALYVGLYSILRFVVEYFRFHPDGGSMILPWLSTAQLICLLLGAFSLTIILVCRRFYIKKTGEKADAGTNI